MSGKFVGGALAVGGIALAGVGLYSMGADLLSAFNNASLSSEAAGALKLTGTVGGAFIGAAGAAVAGATIHRDQELGAIAFAAIYACFGAVGGGYGGYKVTDKITAPMIEKEKPAHVLTLSADQIPAARIPAQFKII